MGQFESPWRNRLSRRFARQRRVRDNYLHHVTNTLVGQASAINIKNFNVQGIIENYCLTAAIARQGWHAFRKQLTYKTVRAEIPLMVVHRFFPGSKRCRTCRVVKASVPLSTRIMSCDACGLVEDRDIDAAPNMTLAAHEDLLASP